MRQLYTCLLTYSFKVLQTLFKLLFADIHYSSPNKNLFLPKNHTHPLFLCQGRLCKTKKLQLNKNEILNKELVSEKCTETLIVAICGKERSIMNARS